MAFLRVPVGGAKMGHSGWRQARTGPRFVHMGLRWEEEKSKIAVRKNQANLMCRPIVGFIIHPSKKVSKLVRRLARRRTNFAYFFEGGKMRPQWAVDEVTMGSNTASIGLDGQRQHRRLGQDGLRWRVWGGKISQIGAETKPRWSQDATSCGQPGPKTSL